MGGIKSVRDADLAHLPNRIRELRLQNGYSLEDLAKRIPGQTTTFQTLQKLETGQIRLTDGHMARIAVALTVHPIELLRDAPGATPAAAVATLEPEERALVTGVRAMPGAERRKVLATLRADWPEYFHAPAA